MLKPDLKNLNTTNEIDLTVRGRKSGKMIPMEVATHANHTCGGMQKEEMDFSI